MREKELVKSKLESCCGYLNGFHEETATWRWATNFQENVNIFNCLDIAFLWLLVTFLQHITIYRESAGETNISQWTFQILKFEHINLQANGKEFDLFSLTNWLLGFASQNIQAFSSLFKVFLASQTSLCVGSDLLILLEG